MTITGFSIRKLLIPLLLSWAFHAPASAAPPVIIDDGSAWQGKALGLHLDIINDPEGKLTIAEVASPSMEDRFVSSRTRTLNFGFATDTYWLRLRLDSSLRVDKPLVLEAAFPLIDHVDFYTPTADSTYKVMSNGEMASVDRESPIHRNPVFEFTLPAGEKHTYYLRFQDNGSAPLPLILWEPDGFVKNVDRQQLLFGLYYGFVLAIILYNIIIYLTVRIRSYLYYIIFAVFYLFWQLAYNGLTNQYLWPGMSGLTHRLMPFLISATGMSALQFARVFLQTRENVPIVHKFLSLLMAGFIIIFLLSLNPSFTGSLPLAALACVLFACATLFTCLYCWKKGVRPARFFSIAWFGLLAGTVLLGLKSFGILPSNAVTEYGQQVGSMLEIALFSLALADQLRSMRLEKEQARAETIHLQQQANLQLEEKVRQRTNDLHKKNRQLQLLATKLAKYLAPQVYSAIFSGRAEVKIHSFRKKLTIFFSDIKGFTELTDTIESEALTAILNEYLNEMAEIALQYSGTIDKYIGDAIMIFFGDPETRGETEDALNCVRMALAMRRRMQDLQKKWQQDLLPSPLRIRMGINTGFCTVGNFGSEDRLDYTIIGGEVNLASRLESAAAPDEILVSYQTYTLIKHAVTCEKKGEIRVKGIAHPVHTYQVIDLHENLAAGRNEIKDMGEGYSLAFDFNRIPAAAGRGITRTLKKIISRLQHAEHSASQTSELETAD
jgi:class 3 adenylate cyclase